MKATATGFPRLEATCLLLALAGLQGLTLFLGSERGLRAFAPGPPVADLERMAPTLLRTEDRTLFLARSQDRPSIARLAGFAADPRKRYVLRVRSTAGLPFEIQMIDSEAERASRSWRVSARPASSERMIAIDPRVLPRSNRLEIRNKTAADLVIEQLEILVLRPSHGRLWTSIRPLAAALLAFFVWRHRSSLAAHFGRASTGHRRGWDLFLAAVLLVLSFHFFLRAPVNQLLDAKFSSVVSHQLLRSGKVTMPDDFSAANTADLPYQLQRVGDKTYHFYPDAVAVLNVPIVAVFASLGMPPVSDGGLFLWQNELEILRVAAALQAALLCALLFALARLYLRPGPALALTAVFAFGTQIFSSVSRPYWSHASALLLLTAAVYLLLAPATRDRRWAMVAAASLLSWSFFCRPPISLAIVALTVYLVFTRRRHLLAFVVIGMVWAALFAVYSMHHFDQPIPPYFLTTHLETGVLGIETMRRSYPSALYGTLFAPSRGLFVYVPFLALVLWLGLRHWSRLSDRALAATALTIVFGHWQLLSANRIWWGGQSFGPRLFADVLVWFFVLAAMALAVELPRLRRQRPVLAAAKSGVAALLVLVSLLINIRGAHARATYAWRAPIWSWRNTQFLAGLLPAAKAPTLGERLAGLRAQPDEEERAQLLNAILRDESLPKRQIEADRMLAAFVTWDAWTYGEAPAALIVINDEAEDFTPRLRLASWAAAEVYPITVRIEDGERTTSHRLAGRGGADVDLSPIPAGSRRLYILWADKTWTPGGEDPRSLGVQLLPREGTP